MSTEWCGCGGGVKNFTLMIKGIGGVAGLLKTVRKYHPFLIRVHQELEYVGVTD